MNALTQKLKSKRGATIIMGLMFFLIAAVIGSTVLTFANINAGRLADMRGEEQDYLTVSSAAKLVRDEIAEATVAFIKTDIVTIKNDIETKRETTPDYTPAIGALGSLIDEWASYIYGGGDINDKISSEFTVQSELEEVRCLFRMDGSYNITISFSLEGGKNPMYLELKGFFNRTPPITDGISSETDSESGITTIIYSETTTTTISWQNPKIKREG